MSEQFRVRWYQPEHELTVRWREDLGGANPCWGFPTGLSAVRFHSLPGSREFPRTGSKGAQDRQELLHRHTTLIAELAQHAPARHLYRPVWDEQDLASDKNETWLELGLVWSDWVLVHELGRHGEFTHEPGLRLVVADAAWPATWGERWLLDTAQERLTHAVLVGAGLSWLARPYPGGIDLSADEACVARLTKTYEAWLPQPW